MSFSMVTLKKENAKKYKGWYYVKICDRYYIFSDDNKTTYMRFTVNDCKKCINDLIANI